MKSQLHHEGVKRQKKEGSVRREQLIKMLDEKIAAETKTTDSMKMNLDSDSVVGSDSEEGSEREEDLHIEAQIGPRTTANPTEILVPTPTGAYRTTYPTFWQGNKFKYFRTYVFNYFPPSSGLLVYDGRNYATRFNRLQFLRPRATQFQYNVAREREVPDIRNLVPNDTLPRPETTACPHLEQILITDLSEITEFVNDAKSYSKTVNFMLLYIYLLRTITLKLHANPTPNTAPGHTLVSLFTGAAAAELERVDATSDNARDFLRWKKFVYGSPAIPPTATTRGVPVDIGHTVSERLVVLDYMSYLLMERIDSNNLSFIQNIDSLGVEFENAYRKSLNNILEIERVANVAIARLADEPDLEQKGDVLIQALRKLSQESYRFINLSAENLELRKTLFIERGKTNKLDVVRVEVFETVLKEEAMLYLSMRNIPSLKFANLVAGYLTMSYLTSVVKIDAIAYLITRSKDAVFKDEYYRIVESPVSAKQELVNEMSASGVVNADTPEAMFDYVTQNPLMPQTTQYGKFLRFITEELKLFDISFTRDKSDTHRYGVNILTPAVYSARALAWDITRNILIEAYLKDEHRGFDKYQIGNEKPLHSMNWIFYSEDVEAEQRQLREIFMQLFARLTTAKYTEAQLSKGHTTEKDKIERIIIYDAIELEIRNCLKQMGFKVYADSFEKYNADKGSHWSSWT
jgi:hypothetical protein